MNELKQETKREERDVENNLNIRTDQYNKKLTLVKIIVFFPNKISTVVFFLFLIYLESKNKSKRLVRSRNSSFT